MVAGNIYEVMKKVVNIEDKVYPFNIGTFPSILFDNVSVPIKGGGELCERMEKSILLLLKEK